MSSVFSIYSGLSTGCSSWTWDPMSLLRSESWFSPDSQCLDYSMNVLLCKSWIIKQAEHRGIDAFEYGAGEDS